MKNRYIRRKFVAAALCLCLVLAWTGGVSASADSSKPTPYTGQTEAGVYTLSSAVQWQKLSDTVNGGVTYADSRFLLTRDVDLSQPAAYDLNGDGKEDEWDETYLAGLWTPIGTAEHPFCGTVSGSGYAVTGIHVETEAEAGLFGVLARATVVRLNTEGTVIGGDGVGGLCGRMLGGSLSGCIGKMNVRGSSAVGGLVGEAQGAVTIGGCANTGAVEGCAAVGGLLGSVLGRSESVPEEEEAAWTPPAGTASVQNSLVRGTVAATEKEAGGLCGRCQTADAAGKMVNNAVYADITAPSSVGGLCGVMFGDITLENNLSAGTVSGDDEVGALIGQAEGERLILCYYRGDGPNPPSETSAIESWECGWFASEDDPTVYEENGEDGIYVRSGQTALTEALSAYAAESSLFADWVTLIYDGNGALCEPWCGYPVPGAFEQEVAAIPILIRPGYSLDRTAWNTEPDGSGKAVVPGTKLTATRSQTLYAVWTEGVALYGDVDGDGAVTMKDVLALRRYIVDNNSVLIDTAAADILQDESIDMKDVLTVRKVIAGLN